MTALPASALLCAWLDAVRQGHAGPDDLEDAVRGQDPRHLVVGLPAHQSAGRSPRSSGAEGPGSGASLELRSLPSVLGAPARLALPVPGDPVGLGGPAPFTAAAVEAGEAVIAGGWGLVPELDARTVVWRAHPADPPPWVDERETALALRTTLLEVTQRLVDLDVAAWQPEIPDLLMNLRRRARVPLPPGMDPRPVETVERAVLCLEIVALARQDEGGAVSSQEMDRRRAALADLERAARHALVGACSARG